MTEGERIIKLETQMDNIENKVDRGFEAVGKSQAELNIKLDNFIEKSENRFASKWVEKAVWGCAAIILTAVILAGLSIILIK